MAAAAEAPTSPVQGGRDPDHFMSTLAPYEVSGALRPRVDQLDLWSCIADLRDQGYTVVKDVAPPALLAELREVIHRFADQSEGTAKGVTAAMLLGRHPIVDRVVTLPKILAVAEASVGMGFRAGQIKGSIKRQGDPALFMHADQSWVPAPFPEHNLFLTFCIPCEGMTEAGGATRVVPGSQRLRRHPRRDEIEGPVTIPVEAERGSVVAWDGSVWHGNGPRTIPGTRTVLHATFQRLYTQPIEDYTHLLGDEEYVASASPALLRLIGAHAFFGTSTNTNGGVDMEKIVQCSLMAKQ